MHLKNKLKLHRRITRQQIFEIPSKNESILVIAQSSFSGEYRPNLRCIRKWTLNILNALQVHFMEYGIYVLCGITVALKALVFNILLRASLPRLKLWARKKYYTPYKSAKKIVNEIQRRVHITRTRIHTHALSIMWDF